MQQRRIVSLTILMFGPCILLLGCAQVSLPRRHNDTPMPIAAATMDSQQKVVRLPPVTLRPTSATGDSLGAASNGIQLAAYEAPASESDKVGTTAQFMAESADTESPTAKTVPPPKAKPIKTTATSPSAEAPPDRANLTTAPIEPQDMAQPVATRRDTAAAPPVKPMKGTASSATANSAENPVPKGMTLIPTPTASPIGAPPPSPLTATPLRNPPITLHVDNMEVRKTLEMLSRQANLNILVSPGVVGTVTLDLRDKSLDETLGAISKLCRLIVRREKDIIYVSTIQEFNLSQEDDLPVRIYRLNYVKSLDVAKMIEGLLSKQGTVSASPDSETGLMSDATKAAEAASGKEVKAGGNSLAGGEIVVVQDYEHVLKKIDRIVAEFDVQPSQVVIEAVIVSVKLEKGMELGVNFGLLDGAAGPGRGRQRRCD